MLDSALLKYLIDLRTVRICDYFTQIMEGGIWSFIDSFLSLHDIVLTLSLLVVLAGLESVSIETQSHGVKK